MSDEKATRLLRDAEWLRANGDFLSEALSIYIKRMEENAATVEESPTGGSFGPKSKKELAETFKEQKVNGERVQRELLYRLNEVAEEELADEKAGTVTYVLSEEQDAALKGLLQMAPVDDSVAASLWLAVLPDALKHED